jgi:hypothetical protein
MKSAPEVLNAVVDVVLAFRPQSKSKKKKRKQKKKENSPKRRTLKI